MSEPPLRIVPTQKTQSDPPVGGTPRQAGELSELRRILLAPEQLQLKNIIERLNNPRIRAKEASRTLTEAIVLRNLHDDSLKEALGPTIVKAFQNSVKRDPQPIADAISPLMGPAIRRYISMMLNGMVQSFDHAMKNSLSLQGLKWRIEAARTGKPFGEIVMLHTLLYRVEQVFLIHRNSGIKLAHVTSPSIQAQDPDLVSGMMTAMRDALKNFARDSFGSSKDNAIDKLDLGDREVWLEMGPRAAIAVVIRGEAPERLRGELFAPAIEAIHKEMGTLLESFDGDTRPFELVRHHLESCLQQEIKGAPAKNAARLPVYLWLVPLLLILGLAIWGFFALREQGRWNGYLKKLRQTPGIVITEEGNRNGKRYIEGLRDPLAEDPEKILREQTSLDPATIEHRWELYQALDKLFVELRARQLLEPPMGVELIFTNGVLIARGKAPLRWINDTRKFARAVPGISRFDSRELTINEFREINQRIIIFDPDKCISAAQEIECRHTVDAIKSLLNAAPPERRFQIEIIGHTDNEGTAQVNERLSLDRAERVQSLFAGRGIPNELLTIRGAASREPLRPQTSEAEKQFNRSVSFKVVDMPGRL